MSTTDEIKQRLDIVDVVSTICQADKVGPQLQGCLSLPQRKNGVVFRIPREAELALFRRLRDRWYLLQGAIDLLGKRHRLHVVHSEDGLTVSTDQV